MTSRREAALGLLISRAMAEATMVQGPDGQPLDTMADLDELQKSRRERPPRRKIPKGRDDG